MNRPRHHPPCLRVVSGGIVDSEIVTSWHEVTASGIADRVVDSVISAIAGELSTFGLAGALSADAADTAIVRSALRGLIVAGLRQNLIRRLIQAKERPEVLAGKSQGERLAYLLMGEPGHDA